MEFVQLVVLVVENFNLNSFKFDRCSLLWTMRVAKDEVKFALTSLEERLYDFRLVERGRGKSQLTKQEASGRFAQEYSANDLLFA